MNNQTFRGVQALRGIAALSVMLFHFRWNINAVSPGIGDRLFGWGATGVDLFFLISGFVITLSATRSEEGINGSLNFLKKRALRILPTYYIILIITFFLSGAMSTFHYADKTENFISSLAFIPIYPEHGPFYVDDNGMYGIRWTLNYEVLFYILMSISLLFSKRLLSAFLLFSMTLIVLPLAIFGGLTLNPAGYNTASPYIGLITNPMVWLFIAGAAIGLLAPHLQWLSGRLMACVALISIAMTGYLFNKGQYVGHGLLSSGWLYAIILFSVVLSERFIGRFVPNSLIKLGDISFSLYLIHTLMNGGIGKRFESLGIEDGYMRLMVSVILSLLLSWLSYRYIEGLFLDKRKKAEVAVSSRN